MTGFEKLGGLSFYTYEVVSIDYFFNGAISYTFVNNGFYFSEGETIQSSTHVSYELKTNIANYGLPYLGDFIYHHFLYITLIRKHQEKFFFESFKKSRIQYVRSEILDSLKKILSQIAHTYW